MTRVLEPTPQASGRSTALSRPHARSCVPPACSFPQPIVASRPHGRDHLLRRLHPACCACRSRSIGGGAAKPGRAGEGGRELGRGQRHHGRRRGDRLPARDRARERRRGRCSRRRRIRSRRSRAPRSSRRRSTSGATSTPPTSATRCAPGPTRSGSALDAVKAGSAKRVLVVVADTRMAAPRSAVEGNLGDGGGRVPGRRRTTWSRRSPRMHSVADEIIDVWRTEGDPFVHAWEDRFVVDHGYRRNVREVGEGAPRQGRRRGRRRDEGGASTDPTREAHATVVRELGFDAGDAGAGPALRQGRQRGRGAGAAAARRARSSRRRRARSFWSSPTATAPTRSLLETTPHVERLEGRRGVGVAPGAAGGDAELRHVPPLPPVARDRARPARRRGALGHQALPRSRRGHHAARAAVPALPAGAVPAPARLLPVLRAGRVRQAAPLRPHRHRALVHLRQLRRQPEHRRSSPASSRSTARASTCR